MGMNNFFAADIFSNLTPPLNETYHYSYATDWLIPILIGVILIIITIIIIFRFLRKSKTIDNDSHQQRSKRKILFAVLLLAVEIIAVAIPSSILYFNYQNSFDADISNAEYAQYASDYTFSYISDENGVTVSIAPTYDIKDFSFTICYYGPSSSDNYSEEYEYEFSQAKVSIQIFVSAETLDAELRGDFISAKMQHVYGKKQNKNIDNPSHTVHH